MHGELAVRSGTWVARLKEGYIERCSYHTHYGFALCFLLFLSVFTEIHSSHLFGSLIFVGVIYGLS
jgi:hypothetical protein